MEREPRKFSSDDEPPKGVSKKAIHVMILLLFLIAAFIIFFPSPAKTDDRDGTDADTGNTELSSVDIAVSDGVFWYARGFV
jgi:hypothetical protein